MVVDFLKASVSLIKGNINENGEIPSNKVDWPDEVNDQEGLRVSYLFRNGPP